MLQKSRILVNFLSKRSMSNRVFQINTLKLHEHGNLEDNTLKLSTTTLKESDVNLKQNELFVKLIAAPINPADINTIQGNYSKTAMPLSLPSVIGNEGLFEVVKVSEANKNIQIGDWVIPIESGWGTWRSHAIENQEKFLKIPKNLNKHACATLTVNPCTAYRLLNDFKKLKPNDTVIQNGANSGVGQAVIQLGSMMNINVVNIVRKRENQNELNDYLTSLGAKHIFTEDDLRKSNQLTVDLWSKIPKPRLAFNCVGGKATSDMIRLLDNDSIMVTYGGMSRQPVTLNTADFIFKNFKAVGFWLTSWRKENPDAFKETIQALCGLIGEKKFLPPKCEEFNLKEYERAFKRYQTKFLDSKILFTD